MLHQGRREDNSFVTISSEEAGFEPAGLLIQLFSKQLPSTTRTFLHDWDPRPSLGKLSAESHHIINYARALPMCAPCRVDPYSII